MKNVIFSANHKQYFIQVMSQLKMFNRNEFLNIRYIEMLSKSLFCNTIAEIYT